MGGSAHAVSRARRWFWLSCENRTYALESEPSACDWHVRHVSGAQRVCCVRLCVTWLGRPRSAPRPHRNHNEQLHNDDDETVGNASVTRAWPRPSKNEKARTPT